MSATDVSPQAIRRELSRLGFREYDTSGRAGVTWANPLDEEGVAVLVPREEDQHLRGYHESLASAVERLAWLTEEPIERLQQRLSGVGDRIEMRIVHQITEQHRLRVLDAPAVMSGFVELIKNGARTAFTGARAVHSGVGGPDYDDALNGIEVLAPAPGSFRLIAVSSEAVQLALSSPAAPLKARGALVATLRSLSALSRESRRANELDETDIEVLVDAGVSKQLLSAVDKLAITETSGLELEFLGSFDATLGPTDAPNDAVVLSDAHISLARGLHPLLTKYEPVADYHLRGWVETTKAEGLSFEGFPAGTVIVREKHAGRLRDVLVALDSETFPSIHAGVSEVDITGTLERISGRWHLTAPRDVRVSRAERPDE